MPQVVSIQYLRGFAALLVLFYHIGNHVPDTGLGFKLGSIGVDIFFVISGIIIWITGRNLTPAEFLKRRLIRLVPLYWAVTLLVALAISASGGLLVWSELLHSLAFLAHSPSDPGAWPQPILLVGWTLNLEMLFYLCMAGTLIAPARARLAILAMALGGLVAIGFLLPSAADPRLLFYTSSFMAEFLIGICLGVLWTSGRIPAFNRVNLLLFTAAVICLSLMPLDDVDRLVAYGGFVTLLVLLALMAEPRLRERPVRPLHVLGDASYSLYLTHLPVIIACNAAAAAGMLPAEGLVLAAIVMVATLIVGLACHYGFERPVHRALTARLASKADPPTIPRNRSAAAYSGPHRRFPDRRSTSAS